MNKIKILRKSKGLTQHDVAKMLQVSQNYISDIENGKRKGSINLLLALAKVLDTTVDELCN